MYIPNQWYAILEADELKAGQPQGFRRLGVDMVGWRDAGGAPVVMEDRCAHRQIKLSLGKIVDNCIECPFHGFRYDTEGACQRIPANGINGPVPKSSGLRLTRSGKNTALCGSGTARPRLNIHPSLSFLNSTTSPILPFVNRGRLTTRELLKTSLTWRTCPLSTQLRLAGAVVPWWMALLARLKAMPFMSGPKPR